MRPYYQAKLQQTVKQKYGGNVIEVMNGRLWYIAVKTEMVAPYVAIKLCRLVLMI